jgi:hypothetical protein
VTSSPPRLEPSSRSARGHEFTTFLGPRAERAGLTPAARRPQLDDQGCLHFGAASVALSAPERAVVEALVDAFEDPVACAVLRTVGAQTTNLALVHLLRGLDERVNTLGLEVDPVRRDAYVLRRAPRELAPSPPLEEPVDAPGPPVPPRSLGRRRTLPMHFRSGLLAPDLP